MATKSSYSYHAQLLLLTQALEALKRVQDPLDRALDVENAQVGRDEAAQGGYWALAQGAEQFREVLEVHLRAVKALASMCPPDPVERHDPTDYSQDARFHQMIDHAFDVALSHGVEAEEVVRALGAAVAKSDQR